jgi:hypothetical protein
MGEGKERRRIAWYRQREAHLGEGWSRWAGDDESEHALLVLLSKKRRRERPAKGVPGRRDGPEDEWATRGKGWWATSG